MSRKIISVCNKKLVLVFLVILATYSFLHLLVFNGNTDIIVQQEPQVMLIQENEQSKSAPDDVKISENETSINVTSGGSNTKKVNKNNKKKREKKKKKKVVNKEKKEERLNNNNINNATHHSIQYTAPNIVLNLYQMLYDIDKILIKNNVTYWIGTGTMLGAVRHKGLIPWDDDADIGILHRDEHIISNSAQFKQDLLEYGYDFIKHYWYHSYFYKIFSLNGTDIKKKFTVPFTDIFVWEKVAHHPDKLRLRRNESFNYNETVQELSMYRDKYNLFPLKRYKFGDIELFGANNPYPNLNRKYGKDWNVTTYKEYNHLKEERNNNEQEIHIKNIENIEREPGKPLGPIRKW